MEVFGIYNLWNHLNDKEKNEYFRLLKIFGALSGLFKDNNEGKHAKKPYLYYRNHEKLFVKMFNVKDLTRHDSAFDALAEIAGERIGIGLKTWIHTKNITYQKVAEFNKVSPTHIQPLIQEGDNNALINEIARLRNERIELDIRQYATSKQIYHNITRDDNSMNIVEQSYDLVQLDSLKLLNAKKGTYQFTDGLNKYKFYSSKSVLLKEFDASNQYVLERLPIVQYNDPFDLLSAINSPTQDNLVTEEIIYLPIYSDNSYKVEEKSGFNSWNAAPKNKGSNLARPDYEAYIPIPIWIHHVFPNFFGFDPLIKKQDKKTNGLNLHLPDGRIIAAIVTQAQGKSLQTTPQNILGKWILHDVLGLKTKELLTSKHLVELGVDSLQVTKVDNNNFKIELAETHAFEKWKYENHDLIKSRYEQKKFQIPKFRTELFEDNI